MSEYIKKEIKGLERMKNEVIKQLKNEIFTTQYKYDLDIKNLKEKCEHKEATSKLHGVPMGFCEYCGIDL